MNGNKKDVIFVVTCDTSNLYATTNYDKYLVPPFLKLEGPLQKDRSVANSAKCDTFRKRIFSKRQFTIPC